MTVVPVGTDIKELAFVAAVALLCCHRPRNKMMIANHKQFRL